MNFSRLICVVIALVSSLPQVFGFSPDYFTMSGSGTYDLSIQKVSDLPGPFSPGQDISFTITVTNEGNCDANNIQITDFLPSALTLSAMDTNGWVPSGSDITNTIPFIPFAAGSNQVSIPVILTIDPLFTGMFIDNQAAITLDDGDDIDSDPSLGFDDDDDGDGNNIDDDESIATIQISPIMSLETIDFGIFSSRDSDMLRWRIASDVEFNKFELQLLTDTFSTIGTLESRDGISEYNMEWFPKMDEERYYRIKASLPSGVVNYTHVVVGEIYTYTSDFDIFPNPASEFFRVNRNSDQPIKIDIFDNSGKRVLQTELIEDSQVDISSLEQSIYFVRIKSPDSKRVWTRLVVLD